ncbi:MAG: class I SAM-dependent methyltransferase [Cyclobacteriaceae bacterium]
MINRCLRLSIVALALSLSSAYGQSNGDDYTFRSGDRSGIGKWYMGREIAHVMGYQGIGWLERSEREKEENTLKLIEYMDIRSADVIADIGSGSGYHVFKMAPKAKQVFAVDIQQEMLTAIENKMGQTGDDNITLIKGSEQSVNLPGQSVDKVLMVDVYHEFSFPVEMIQSIKKALKPDGKIYLIEYRGEDRSVPIKRLHKMTEAQAVKEMEAAGFKLAQNIPGLPWQHCMMFAKK